MRCALIYRQSRQSVKPQLFQSLTNCNSTSHTQVPSPSSSPTIPTFSSTITDTSRDCKTRMGRQTRHSKSDPTFTTRQTRSSNQVTSSSSGTVGSDKMVALKSVKTEVAVPHRSSGGRHLQPPTGNDAKLKHKCPFEGCPWRFATPYKLRRHIKSHTKETPYQCKECGRGFSVRYNLLMHVQTIHSTPQKYCCPVRGCKDAFHTQPRLNGHLRKVHKTDIKQIQAERNESIADSDMSDSNAFTCKECQRVFTTQAKLNVHSRTHLSNIRPFKCSVEGCHKSFQTAEKLEKHNQTHSSVKSWVCPYKDCKRVFLKQSYLKSHLKVHAKEQFLCPIPGCEHKLSSELEYNDHVSLHMGYSLPCPQCSLVFPTPKRLELHCHVAHANVECLPSGYHPLSLVAPTTPTTPLSVSSSFSQVKDEPKGEKSNIHSLPYLKVEEVEAVISHHTNDHFLSSLSSFGEVGGTEYESDSGYSTFDVSPHGSHTSTGFFNNPLLSPAITPVTPTPGLPNSTSPVSFGFSDDGILIGGNGHHFFPGSAPPPLSASSSCDGNFFFGQSGTPGDALTDHTPFSFPPSCSQPKKEPNQSSTESTEKVLQTAQKATRNLSSFEDSKQTVVLVPNSFNSIVAPPAPHGSQAPAPPVSSVTVLTTPPPVKAEDSVVITIKPEIAYTESHSNGIHVQPPVTKDTVSTVVSKPSSNPSPGENGRLVYARVVPVSNGSTCTALPNKGTGKSSGSKSRHRGGVSKRSKGGSGHKSNQWPKSMNPGNLVAFRNFILKKLNKEQGENCGEEEELVEELGDNRLLSESDSFPPYHESLIGAHAGLIPDCDNLEEIFKDIDFNPDSLLSLSETQDTFTMSPFSATGTSSSDPFSPSSSSSGCGFNEAPRTHSLDETMDFDGFFHMFDATPGGGVSSSSLSVGPPGSDSELDLLSLSQDLDMIFKSDADPLLGGIS